MASNAFVKGRVTRSWEAFARHAHGKRTLERSASAKSRAGLDWTNFFMSDVQVGFGSFVAFYLAHMSWSQERVGIVLAVGQLVGVVSLMPGGALLDAVRAKRGLAATGIAMIASAAVILAAHPTFVFVVAAEVLHGLTAGILGPAVAAISLGLVGRHAMATRVGRNHRFNAAGNVVTAALMGVLATYISANMIFVVAAILAIPALVALASIDGNEIDHRRARNAGKDQGVRPHRIGQLLKNHALLWFAASIALFQLADASMLPLVGEAVARSAGKHSSLFMSALVVTPQILVALLAPWVGYASELWGRKPLLMVGFGIDGVRAALFGFADGGVSLILIQMLDGVSGAIVTVLTVVIVTDLTTGSGRFNLARGTISMVAGLAASLSILVSGYISQEMGRLPGFLSLAAVAAVATAVVWLFVGETKPSEYID
jgi:MFS family permease